MSYQKLERAAKMYAALKAIDQEIGQITDLAGEISEGSAEIHFHLNVKPKAKPLDPNDELRRDLMDFEQIRMAGLRMFNSAMSTTNMFDRPIDLGSCYTKPVSDSVAMRMLAVLMEEKQNERRKLVNEIKEMNLV